MKQIKAVIRPEKAAKIRNALKSAGCYHGLMFSDIVGQGTQKGITQTWNGGEYQLELVPKVMLDLVVLDSEVEEVKKIIIDCARTGDIGDGKIFIYNVEDVVRIRTGEEGETAV